MRANSKESGYLPVPGKTIAITVVALALWVPKVSIYGPEKAPANEF